MIPRSGAQRERLGEGSERAEQIHGEGRELLAQLVGHHLGEGGLVANGLTRLDHGAHAVEEEPERLDLGGEGGEAAAHAGIAREQGSASRRGVGVLHELAQEARERGRLVEAAPEAVGVEPGEERLKALALAPEHAVGGHAHVVEEDLVVIHLAGQAPDRPDVHARRVVGDDEHGEAAAAARLAAGARQHEAVVRDAGVTAPDLVAADDVLVAVAPRLGVERQEVRARAGLAEALPEGHLAAPDPRQHLGLQIRRPVADDRPPRSDRRR